VSDFVCAEQGRKQTARDMTSLPKQPEARNPSWPGRGDHPSIARLATLGEGTRHFASSATLRCGQVPITDSRRTSAAFLPRAILTRAINHLVSLLETTTSHHTVWCEVGQVSRRVGGSPEGFVACPSAGCACLGPRGRTAPGSCVPVTASASGHGLRSASGRGASREAA
jgi:hypothetical protein